MYPSDANAMTATTWDVDGEQYRIVRLSDVVEPTHRGDLVGFLADLLECNLREAEHAYRVLIEDGEFIMSVQADIDGLPGLDA